jgi:crotonobetainyl-CoA:carnitine CoA-transferase CaiB-like acyl-CoA transferase
MTVQDLPLSGVTICEMGHSVAAPFAAQILGDLGADVVKVEKPTGDDARKWGPPFWEGAAATFQALNRNKRSVALDLRDEVQRGALRGFILDKVDVVLQNMRPGQVETLGLGSEDLLSRKSSLVYCNLGAFGRSGPLADAPGYDPLMQAFGGVMSVTGEPGRPPVRVGCSIIDMGTGLWAAVGILAALRRREVTGRGGVVDVSLFETAVAWMTVPVSQYLASGEVPQPQGSGAQGIVPYRSYRTADGDLVVAAGNDGLFRSLCHVLGHSEWFEDPRFRSNPDRVAHQTVLYGLIEREMVTRSTSEWTALLEQAGVPCAPVQDVATMLSHPQTAALGIIQQIPGSAIRGVGLPVSFDGERPTPRSPPPGQGADTAMLDIQPERRCR